MTTIPPELRTLPPVTLVLGGARSGKSALAEVMVLSHGHHPIYLATAAPAPAEDDAEMSQRILRHQERRGTAWTTIETPLAVPAVLETVPAGTPVLIDCLTFWLSNLMLGGHDIGQHTAALLAALAAPRGPVVMVSNEVGLGIVPDNALARAFRDHAGELNQIVAAQAQRVVFVAAGLPLVLKNVVAAPLETP
ncbi:MAG: bifunctional adenosylcobinamide kinase/adenosylcobinamide-phosphate guanylyltransferase [Alphaproteobacteria bacterium]|nr:bifunctional adenosylcobinamide kinase/adenosylcobinamide-phosphate guanylyltransferase [Alphaproteobacteria bacterium]